MMIGHFHHDGGGSAGVSSRAGRRKPVEEDALAREKLLAGFFQGEPAGAVDLGERLLAPALRRPLELEAVAADRRHVEIALSRKGDDALAARLDGLSQGLQLALQGDAELLRELAPGGGFRILAVEIFALRNRPGAGVLPGPERPAGMHEEDAELPALALVEQHAGAFHGHAYLLTRVIPEARSAIRDPLPRAGAMGPGSPLRCGRDDRGG